MENQPPLSITNIDKLDTNSLFLMGIAYKQFRAKIAAEMSDISGISLEMYGALKVLQTHGQMTQQELSNYLLRNRSVMKRLMDNAIKLDLVNASKSKTNKKIKLLSLTKQGQKIVEKCEPIVEEVSAQSQAALEGDECKKLTQLLAKLVSVEQLVD